jgi:molybdopterin-guanine dinucleotide biosynthesis protein A
MISLVAAVVFATVMALPAFAADVTVKGEVVDIACATSKGAGGKGNGHAACAMSCARRGQPVGLLNDEAIYEITGDFAANNNAKLLDFVAKSVTVTGEVTEQGGKKLLNIKTIKAN